MIKHGMLNTCHPSHRETESRQVGSLRTQGSLAPAVHNDDDTVACNHDERC